MSTKSFEFRNKFLAEKFGEVLSKRGINFTVDYQESSGKWIMFVTDSARVLSGVQTLFVLVA